MLGGVVVGTKLGVSATVLYLLVYMAMNIVCVRRVVTACASAPTGDDISAFAGLGAVRLARLADDDRDARRSPGSPAPSGSSASSS